MTWVAHATSEGDEPEVWCVVNLSGPTVLDWRYINDLTPEYAKSLAAALNARDLRMALQASLEVA